MAFNNPILAALRRQQSGVNPNDPLGLGPGVPTAAQQGLTQNPLGINLVPPGTPVPNAAAAPQDTGLLAKIMQLLQSPGVLPTIGAVGSAFAGRDQLEDFQRVTLQNRQHQLAQRAARAEEARVEISRENLRVNKGNLTARQEEERNRVARETARARAAELKAKQDNEQAIIGIMIRDGQPVSEDRLVRGFGAAAKGVSIKKVLGDSNQVRVQIPPDRTDILDSLPDIGDDGIITLPAPQASALLGRIVAGRPTPSEPRAFHIDGKIIERDPATGDYREVFDVGREPKVDKPTNFPLLEQQRIRDHLAENIDGWEEMNLVARNNMINEFRNIELSGSAPQPVTSKVSRGMFNFLRGLVGREQTEEEVQTGIRDPNESNVIRFDSQGRRIP